MVAGREMRRRRSWPPGPEPGRLVFACHAHLVQGEAADALTELDCLKVDVPVGTEMMSDRLRPIPMDEIARRTFGGSRARLDPTRRLTSRAGQRCPVGCDRSNDRVSPVSGDCQRPCTRSPGRRGGLRAVGHSRRPMNPALPGCPTANRAHGMVTGGGTPHGVPGPRKIRPAGGRGRPSLSVVSRKSGLPGVDERSL